MNMIDEQIIEILKGPYQIITNDVCCWEVVCMVSAWGGDYQKIFRACSKKEIDRYVSGYTYIT